MGQNKQPKMFGGKVGLLDLTNFTKHMSVMLKSGISISETLETLYAQTKAPRLKKAMVYGII